MTSTAPDSRTIRLHIAQNLVIHFLANGEHGFSVAIHSKVKVYIYRESWQLENGEIDGYATFQHKRFRQQRTVMEIVLSLFLILHKNIKSNLSMRKIRNFLCFFICSFHLNCPTTEEQITDRQVLLGVTQKVSSNSKHNLLCLCGHNVLKRQRNCVL